MSEYTLHIDGFNENGHPHIVGYEPLPGPRCGHCAGLLKVGRQWFQVVIDPETGIGAEHDGMIVCRTCSWDFVSVQQISGRPEKHREHYDREAQQALHCCDCGKPLIAQVALCDDANVFCRECAKVKKPEAESEGSDG